MGGNWFPSSSSAAATSSRWAPTPLWWWRFSPTSSTTRAAAGTGTRSRKSTWESAWGFEWWGWGESTVHHRAQLTTRGYDPRPRWWPMFSLDTDGSRWFEHRMSTAGRADSARDAALLHRA